MPITPFSEPMLYAGHHAKCFKYFISFSFPKFLCELSPIIISVLLLKNKANTLSHKATVFLS